MPAVDPDPSLTASAVNDSFAAIPATGLGWRYFSAKPTADNKRFTESTFTPV
jgi:hypothetical protein